jgi:5-methylcytosine-specific restriction protein A
MQSPRSRNLNRKPKAAQWIADNQERSALLLEAIRALEANYGGDFSGFVDFEPAEYRFNDKQSGEYVILSACNNGEVRVRVQLGSNDWDEVELTNLSGLKELTQFIEKHNLTSFDFETVKKQTEFEAAVTAALNDTESERKERLNKANPEPEKVWRKVAAYVRNPDVVADVLHHAAGTCQSCGKVAPFNRSSNGTPYLEVHHIKPLSQGGDDTVANAIALCPNCHRKKHFG